MINDDNRLDLSDYEQSKGRNANTDIDETWRKCLNMWRWISDVYGVRRSNCTVHALKVEWREKHDQTVFAACYFCAVAESNCTGCPGKLVAPTFNCYNPKYSFQENPKAFYVELLRLDAIRKRKIQACPHADEDEDDGYMSLGEEQAMRGSGAFQ